MNEQTTYTGYEYKRVTAESGMESLWKDSLANFGWTGEKSEAKVVKRLPVALWILAAPLSLLPGGPFRKQLSDHASSKQVEITFKRARTLPRKQELDQLEDKFEHCARSIESLNVSKGTAAAIAAGAVGLVGTGFLALSTFAYLAGLSPAFAAAAVPGFLGWILPFFLYRSMKASKERAIVPKIEAQYDSIYNICQAGNEILKTCG